MTDDYKPFLCDYQYDGRNWSCEIKALSLTDARARLSAIRHNGHIEGRVEQTIQFWPEPNLFVRLYTWFRNAVQRGEG